MKIAIGILAAYGVYCIVFFIVAFASYWWYQRRDEKRFANEIDRERENW